ncbi:MAG: 16S rRNA (uracil(1498)-N(3))-methyltransferase [Patescibacteria group bacterium]|nr:16S rRNA (uracil(1498)-N(3))-methyltransferase [Patescibacteria group bacterium]MDW8279558.1 RsmE family RNA methyltransferase [bacterium]
MRLHRFFYDFDLTKNKVLIQDKEIIHQIKKVLRLKVDKEIFLFNNKNQEALVKIKNFDNGMILAEILNVYEINREPQKEVNLYVAILKKENFEIVCQKTTEIGVSNIIPIITEYTVKLNLKYERLERIIKEAAEQSGRTKIPNILKIEKFNEVVSKVNQNDLNLLFDPQGQNFKEVLQFISTHNKINVFIGPEGGWSENEIVLTKQNNFKIVSISSLTFRAETAAQIAVFLSVYF